MRDKSLAVRCVPAIVGLVVLGCLDVTAPPGLDEDGFPPPQEKSSPGTSTFEALAVGRQVTVEFESEGCFHHDRGTATLTRTEAGITIHVVSEAMSPALDPKWKLVRDTTLDIAAVRKLDRLMAFYRSGPGTGCTTRERITVRGLSDQKDQVEVFVDESCGTMERRDVLPIGYLFMHAAG